MTAPKTRIVPTARQLEFQEWEMGVFFHFGIRTFFEGHRDWQDREMPASAFDPACLNCDQWMVSVRRAGMRYAVLVCKHHDGFANWPSHYGTYNVSHAPWKGGKGDVVREFTDACRRHGVKVGLYYSPAEMGNPVFKDAAAYDEHFLNQIRELLGNYGEIDMLWFDGCGSEGHEYDWKRIIAEIRRLQPNLLIFNMGDPDYRWVGNEAGVADLPNWNTVEAVRLSVNTDADDAVGASAQWLPAECDCRMRRRNWFYEEADIETVKPLEELMGLYLYSVGRGANLLINIGPDRLGKLPDADTAALVEFGAEIRRQFGHPLACMADGTLTDLRWEYTSADLFYLDAVTLEEDLRDGESVRRFAIRAVIGGRILTLHEGRNIGHKAICILPLVACQKVIVEITEAEGPVRLRDITLHNRDGLVCRV